MSLPCVRRCKSRVGWPSDVSEEKNAPRRDGPGHVSSVCLDLLPDIMDEQRRNRRAYGDQDGVEFLLHRNAPCCLLFFAAAKQEASQIADPSASDESRVRGGVSCR